MPQGLRVCRGLKPLLSFLQIDLYMVQALCLRQVLVGERTVIDCKYKKKDLQQEGWFLPVGTEIKLFRTQCKVAALGLE